MISIYKEGDGVDIGLNIGWVLGPVIAYRSVSLKKNISKAFYIRFSTSSMKFTFRSRVRENFRSCVVREALSGCFVITEEVRDEIESSGVKVLNSDIGSICDNRGDFNSFTNSCESE
jgi:hypothetical protein